MTAYALGEAAAVRRARVLSAVGAATSLAPLVLSAELLARTGVRLPSVFWGVSIGIGTLVAVRAFVQYGTAKRRLASMRITVDDTSITTETARQMFTIARSRVARIVEIEGPLGGLRIEADDPKTGAPLFASVPRGGDGFAEVRERLGQWRGVERRGRRGPMVRWIVGAAVVAAIFFLPFVVDDLVGRSRVAAGLLVALAWVAMRWGMRGR